MTLVEMHRSGELGRVEARLVARFCPPLPREEVERHLRESIVFFHDARVQVYLPILIERDAVHRLETAAHQRRDPTSSSPTGGSSTTSEVRTTRMEEVRWVPR
jgi:hypothetical protein